MVSRQIYIWKLVILVALFTACDADAPEPKSLPDLRPVSAEEKLLIDNSNDLLFQSFQHINRREPQKNTFFSPVSIGMALSMAYNGANNGTRELIGEISGMKEFSTIQINKAYNELIGFMRSLDQDVNINLANSFWYEQNLPVNTDYRDIVMAYYDAESEGIDFNNNHMAGYVSRIIEAKSNGLITNSITDINKDHHSFIYNAASFNGQWAEPFDYVVPGLSFNKFNEKISCDYIFRKSTPVLYFENEDMLITEISFGNRQFSNMIVMPKNPEDYMKLSTSLDYRQIFNWKQQLDTFNINLQIPAFDVDYKVDLNDLFTDIGLSELFNENADFSNIFTAQDKACIDLYEHRALMKINTEYLPIINDNYLVDGHSLQMVQVNHPFFCFISEKHTGLLLFAGKIVNPLE